ncbi:MAG: M20/M25/M40 family metallo-hydrolase [Ruminococcus sp.]|nr:M20/M25/M40 family metallo-hydrolase [Ruminococcus sp.]
MNFGKTILKYKDELLSDLKQLMEIKSVSAENPAECERALEFMLKRASDFGLETKNIKNKAGHAQIGNSGRLCAVLTHLDVVPAGSNWTVEPFTLTRGDGRLYGRGIDDDKGASIVDLYCLRALKDAGIEGKNTVRAVFGTDEEIGITDMETYFSSEPLPDMSFTPDSDYGICYAEKGILQLKLSGEKPTGTESFSAGSALNAVPDYAETKLLNGETLTSSGTAAHACMPHKGDNAAVSLIEKTGDYSGIFGFIKSYIGRETDGSSLGIKTSDEPSGGLSCCLGKVRINSNECYFTLDIRYPVTKDADEILNRIKILCENNNLVMEIVHHSTPLYLPKDSELVQTLSKAYCEITGEKPKLYSTGGGTYARTLGGKGAAFGPAFPGDTVNMHKADESMDEENFFLHAQICLQAIYEMYTME